MSMEIVRRSVDDALANPNLPVAHRRLLGQMQALDARAQANSAEEARIAERDRQLEAELKTIGERAGVPIGRYLAVRGVTKATPILRVLPEKIFYSSSRSVGFFGESDKGAEIALLLPEASDRGSAFAALNLLRQAAEMSQTEVSGLTRDSVMGDIAKLRIVSGIGQVRLSILKAAKAELPEPVPAVSKVQRNRGLSPLGLLRRLARLQRSR